MKKVMATLLVLGMGAMAVSAQNTNLTKSSTGVRQEARPAGTPKHKTPDEWVNELDQVVALSPEQKTQAKALAEQTEAKMKALRQEATADREALKEKRMQIHKEQKAALDKILNDAQKAKWKAHRMAQMEARGGKQGQHRSPEQMVSELDAIVGLSTEQKAQVKTLAETKQAKMKALHEEQKANPNEEAFKQKRREIGQEYRTGLEKVLTADQKAKLKAAMDAKKAERGKQDK